MDVVNDLRGYLSCCRFEEFCEYLEKIPAEDRFGVLASLADKEPTMAMYGALAVFARFPESDFLISQLLAVFFCHVDGVTDLALFHAVREARENPSVEFLEWVLFFFGNPDIGVSKEFFIPYVDKLLEIDPDNRIAVEIKLRLINKMVH